MVEISEWVILASHHHIKKYFVFILSVKSLKLLFFDINTETVAQNFG